MSAVYCKEHGTLVTAIHRCLKCGFGPDGWTFVLSGDSPGFWLGVEQHGTIAPEYDIASAAEPDPLEAECQQLRVICREQAALISKLTAEVEACESRNDLLGAVLAKERAEVARLRGFEPKGVMPATALRFGVP